MKCAQCEQAEARIRCLDEGLEYCDRCSQSLHSKKARKHHKLETVVVARLCDECETALAKLQCADCGAGKDPLVFCIDCCFSLHARSARASHVVLKFGSSRCLPVDLCVDLGMGRQMGSRKSNDVDLERVKKQAGLEEIIDLTNIMDDKDEVTQKSGHQKLKRVKIEAEGLKRNTLEARKEYPVNARSAPGKTFSSPRSNISSSDKNPNPRQCKKEKTELQPQVEEDSRRSKFSNKKTPREVSEEESSSEESTSDGDVKLNGTHKIRRGSVTVEAFVVDATDHDGTGPAHTDEASEEAASGIRFRIKKMLELGLHPDTPEIEAQQALKNAQRLLTKHNLEQAEVLKGNLTDTSTLVGGMRVVELRAKGRAKLGRMESWVLELGWVISDNFDSQFFFKAGSASKPFRVVFYGISQNADCAGYAFAATFNRITIMSAEYIVKSVGSYDEAEKENQDVKSEIKKRGINTRVARANYRRGIVAGLKEAVEHARKMRSPQTPQRGQKTKLSDGKDSDADFSFDNVDKDGDCDSSERDEDCDTPTKFAWRCMALTALVQHSKTVGEEFLRSKGIKVRKKTQPNIRRAWNKDAYTQGKNDAKTIDINQKALQDVQSKKKKKSRG